MLTFFCFYVGPLLLPAQWKTMFSTLPWISSGFVSLKGVIFQLSLSSFPLFRQSSDTYLRILAVTQPVDLKTHCLLHAGDSDSPHFITCAGTLLPPLLSLEHCLPATQEANGPRHLSCFLPLWGVHLTSTVLTQFNVTSEQDRCLGFL